MDLSKSSAQYPIHEGKIGLEECLISYVSITNENDRFWHFQIVTADLGATAAN